MNQNEIRTITDRKKPYVKLTGTDGNAFSIMESARSAMRECGWTKAEIGEAIDDMMAGNYNELLRTVCKYCKVD